MPRETFHQELQKLQDDLLLMGSMASQALRDSVDALKKLDEAEANRLIAEDRKINAKKFDIEERCLTLIATQQPMARDMRLIAGILEISGELERIGDYGKGIGRIVLYMEGKPAIKPLVDIPRMAEKSISMLTRSLDAFVNRDLAEARAIPAEDDLVDALYNQVHSELVTIIMSHPDKMEQANYLLWAAHNLERAADRVTNICERVVYTVTGEFVEVDTMEFGVSGTN